ACLQNVPEFSEKSRQRFLQLWHLFFHVRLNALTFGAAQLGLGRRDYLSIRRGGLRRGGRTRGRLSVRGGRWPRADQEIGKTFRRGFGLSCAKQSECLVKPIDKIDDVIPCPFGVRGNLPGEIRALNGDRRNEPSR